jgi:hypothetical protein
MTLRLSDARAWADDCMYMEGLRKLPRVHATGAE